MVCTKVKGEPIFEIVKPIPMHQEIIVYFLPERPEELFFSRMRNTFYRQTMDSILEGELTRWCCRRCRRRRQTFFLLLPNCIMMRTILGLCKTTIFFYLIERTTKRKACWLFHMLPPSLTTVTAKEIEIIKIRITNAAFFSVLLDEYRWDFKHGANFN